MPKCAIISAIFTLFLTQISFATTIGNDYIYSKQCDAIANVCKNAGFINEGVGNKSFWFGCMKPVLYGKTVSGVTIDNKDIKECRKAKIDKMKKELKALQAVK